MEKWNGFEYDVYDTGNGEFWCFEVYYEGTLLAESWAEFSSEKEAEKMAINLTTWLIRR